MEYWNNGVREKSWFVAFTLRVYSRCYDRTITMSASPSTKTIYAGATLSLTNLFSGTNFANGGL